MINLNDNKLAYIIISASNDKFDPLTNNKLNENLTSNLYIKDYTVFNLATYKSGIYDRAYLAMTPGDNDELRFSVLNLLEKYEQEFAIIKYKDEVDPRKIFRNGSELPLNINIYDSNSENIHYIYNGVSFTFTEMKRYFHPKDKKDIKSGMIVEVFNNNKWSERKVINPETEWDNLYMLLA